MINAYDSKNALPNKFLNPDGTYSTLNEILSGTIDSDLFIVVEELPDTGDTNKIYLVPNGEGGFTEYHYVDDKWDIIGSVDIDLSDYYTKTETNTLLNDKQTELATNLTADLLLVNNTAPTLPDGRYYTNGFNVKVNGTVKHEFDNTIFQLSTSENEEDPTVNDYAVYVLFGGGFPYTSAYCDGTVGTWGVTRDTYVRKGYVKYVIDASTSSVPMNIPSVSAVKNYVDSQISSAIGGAY